MTKDAAKIEELYTAWCIAEFEMDCIFDELDEDCDHARFIEAERISRDKLFVFLKHPTQSLRHILLKLEIACEVEDYLTDTLNPDCRTIAPFAIVASIGDIRGMVE